MKIVMTLIAKNEADIIRQNIIFHSKTGVDFFLVIDHNSTDNTFEILKEFEEKGILKVFRKTSEKLYQAEWATELAHMAKNQYNADWVINSDADEFWYSPNYDLKESISVLGKRYRVFPVQRLNFVLTDQFDSVFYKRMIYREKVSLSLRGRPLPPKVLHAASEMVEICWGNHEVKNLHDPFLTRVFRRLKMIRIPELDIVIFHFSYRNFNQLLGKIKEDNSKFQTKTKLQLNDSIEDMKSKSDEIKRFFDSVYYDDSRLKKSIQSGKIVEDLRLKSFFEKVTNQEF